MIKFKIKYILAFGTIASAIAYSAYAGISKLDISQPYGVWNMNVTAADYTDGNPSRTVFAGVGAFKAQLFDGDYLPHENPFVSFCLDINFNLSDPQWWQSSSFASATDNGGVNRVSGSLTLAATLYNNNVSSVDTSTGGKEYGAALQLAIWEVLYEGEGTWDVSAGTGFKVNSGLTSNIKVKANNMLIGLTADPSITHTFWNAVELKDGQYVSAGNQDLIGPVPEPSTYVAAALLGIPVLVNGIRSYRKRRVD